MHILIIGAGNIGFQLSKRLCQQQHDITIIEADPQKAMRAREQLDALVIQDNGASYRVLQEAAIEKIEIVAAMTDSDEVNLMACKLAKRSGVPTAIARVRNPQFTESNFILTAEEMGTDLVIHPEKETADAIVRLIHQSSATYAIELENGKIDVLGVRLEQRSPLLEIPLMELSQRYGNPPMRIVAIDRDYQTLIPKGNDKLVYGDEVFVVCEHDYTPQFISLTGKKDTQVNNVMILGGGLIGRFIAYNLADEVHIKIIERSRNRAEKLASMLPNVLIIHGDGTDFDLLESEGISEMDAFVAVTGDDEKNIITTLLAQHLNVSRSIALVNKGEYLNIISKLGIDAIVSKQALTVNAVQRYIQQQQVASIATLSISEAQMIEYITQEGCKITQKPLKDLKFPQNAIVGGVMRNDRLIIPQGNTKIKAKDRVVVFALPEALPKIDRLFSKERSRIAQLLHF